MKIKRYLTAIRRYTRSKGFGIHSPFAFSFVLNVLRERLPYYAYEDIEKLRELAINESKSFWRHPRIISYKNAKLIFRVVNYFNPKEILQIGTNYGVSSACALAVSSKISLYLCEPNVNEYPVTQQILSHFGNTVTKYPTFKKSLNEYIATESGKEAPFLLVNNVKEDEYSEVLAYLYEIRNRKSVIILRNISTNATMQALWEACRNAAPTGMTFSNGKIAVIVSTNKLPHQNFSLWF